MSFSSSSFTPDSIARLFVRHWGKCLVTFLLVAVVAVGFIFFRKSQFSSQAKFRVLIGRESVTLDPSATTGETVSIYESRENEINSILEVLSSRQLVELVVDAVGVSKIVGSDYKPGILARLGVETKVSAREAAIQTVTRGLNVFAPRNTSVIVIEFTGGSSKLAQQIVKSCVELSLSEHIRANRTTGSHDFFVKQTESAATNLAVNRRGLNQKKTALGITSVEERRGNLASQLSANATARLMVTVDLAANAAKALELKSLIAKLPEQMETQTVAGHPNLASVNMRQQLYQLEILAKEIGTTTTKNHPRYRTIMKQLDEVKKIFEKSQPELQQATTAANPARLTLQLDLLRASSDAAALRARQVALEQQHQQILKDLDELHQNEIEINRLEQAVTLADKTYHDYVNKLQQASIRRQLEDGRISNLTVIQPASFSEQPTGANKKIMIVLGFAVALFSALGVMLLAEWLHRGFRSARDVEEQLGLPVVVSLPSGIGEGAAANS